MKKIVYVGFAFPHHKGLHAGYHQIKEYVHYDYIVDCQNYIEKYLKKSSTWLGGFINRRLEQILGFHVFPYFVLKCWWLSLWRKDLVFHFIYSESLSLPFRKFIGKNISVSTIHQPLDVLEKWKLKKKLEVTDHIILVGNSEVETFKKESHKSVSYIPHGIRTDFYEPDREVSKEHLILTVGDWLRDFEYANDVYQELFDSDEFVEVYVVSNPRNRDKLKKHPRLRFLYGISDENLKSLYQRCSVLFLPLIRYTANNALLEAAACGCNIVIASNHPDNSYIPQEYLRICEMRNAKETARVILESESFAYNYQIADYVKKNYSWEHVGKITEKLLRRL